MSNAPSVSGRTIFELLEQGRAELLRAGIEEAREECERISMKLLNCSRAALQLNARERVDPEPAGQFEVLIEKRKQRIPLAYLLREADFGQETLFVNERCLIPRPETEILVEKVIEVLKREGREVFSLLDMGTGSGAIAVAILRSSKKARGTLLDISSAALEVAGENLRNYGLKERAVLVQGDLFRPFSQKEQWDVIVSNPPYLAARDWENIQEELKFEPREALDGGADGLDFYRRIVAGAKGHLGPGGLLALEVGLGQAGIVSKWLQEAGYDNIQVFEDYSRVPRVVMASPDSH